MEIESLQFIPFMLYSFLSWPLFLKFDQDRFPRVAFLQVLSFPAGGWSYFGTLVRQTVDGDAWWVAIRKHSSNNRITSLIVFSKKGLFAYS